ncbi:MAG: hypothetical protein AAF799_33255 [Myxococcota bacterium]
MIGLEISLTSNPEDERLCREIVLEMMRLFALSDIEALARLNDAWRNVGFEVDDLRHHETADFWATTLYYGQASAWWLDPTALAAGPGCGSA